MHRANNEDMTYGFVREEAYAIVRGQGRPMKAVGTNGKQRRGPAKWSVQEVIGEALRWPELGYLAHFGADSGRVACAPVFVDCVGINPSQAKDWLINFTKIVKERRAPSPSGSKDRKQRIDTPVLLSIVASYPEDKSGRLSPEEVIRLPLEERRRISVEIACHRRSAIQTPAFMQWRDLTLAWVRRRYPANIQAAVIHLDEENLHMHVLLHLDGAPVKPLLAGYSEVAGVKLAGGARAKMQEAHKAAKSALLDDFHQSVGLPCGLARSSPHPRGRKSTAKHKLDVAQKLAERERREAEEAARKMKAAAEAEAIAIVTTARRRIEDAWKRTQKLMVEGRDAHRRQVAAEVKAEVEALAQREASWRALLENLVPDPLQREELLDQHALRKRPDIQVKRRPA